MASATYALDDELLSLARSMEPEEIVSRFRCAACSRMNIGAAKLPCCKESVCDNCQEGTKTKCPVCELELEGAFSFEEHKTMRKSVFAFVKGVAQKRKLAAAKAAAAAGTNSEAKPSLPATPAAPVTPAPVAPTDIKEVKQEAEQEVKVNGTTSKDQPTNQTAPAGHPIETLSTANLAPDAGEDPLPSREQIVEASEIATNANAAGNDGGMDDTASSISTVIEVGRQSSSGLASPPQSNNHNNVNHNNATFNYNSSINDFQNGPSNMGLNNATWGGMQNMNSMMNMNMNNMNNMMGNMMGGFSSMFGNMATMGMDPNMMGYSTYGMGPMNSMGHGGWNNGMNMMNMNMGMGGGANGYDYNSGGYGRRDRYGNTYNNGYRGSYHRGSNRGSYGSYGGGYGHTRQYDGSYSGNNQSGFVGDTEASELTPGQDSEVANRTEAQEGISGNMEGVKMESTDGVPEETKDRASNTPTESNLNQAASFDVQDQKDHIAMSNIGRDGPGLHRGISPPGPDVPLGPSSRFGATRGRGYGNLRGGAETARGRGMPLADPHAGVVGAPTGPKALRNGPAGRGFRGGMRGGYAYPDALSSRPEHTRDHPRHSSSNMTDQDRIRRQDSLPPGNPSRPVDDGGDRFDGPKDGTATKESDVDNDQSSYRHRSRSPRRSKRGHHEDEYDNSSRRDKDRHRSSRHDRSRERRKHRHRSRSADTEDHESRRSHRRRDRDRDHSRDRHHDRDDEEDDRRARRHSKRDRSTSPSGSARPQREFKIAGRSRRTHNSEPDTDVVRPHADPHALEREARNRERLAKEQQRRGEAAGTSTPTASSSRKRGLSEYEQGDVDDEHSARRRKRDRGHDHDYEHSRRDRDREREHKSKSKSSGTRRRGGVFVEGELMAGMDAAEDAREAGRWD